VQNPQPRAFVGPAPEKIPISGGYHGKEMGSAPMPGILFLLNPKPMTLLKH